MWASPFKWFELLFSRELLLWCSESQNYWFIYAWYSSERSKLQSRYKLQITPAQQIDTIHTVYSTETQTEGFMQKTECSVRRKAKSSRCSNMSTCPDKAFAKTAKKILQKQQTDRQSTRQTEQYCHMDPMRLKYQWKDGTFSTKTAVSWSQQHTETPHISYCFSECRKRYNIIYQYLYL